MSTIMTMTQTPIMSIMIITGSMIMPMMVTIMPGDNAQQNRTAPECTVRTATRIDRPSGLISQCIRCHSYTGHDQPADRDAGRGACGGNSKASEPAGRQSGRCSNFLPGCSPQLAGWRFLLPCSRWRAAVRAIWPCCGSWALRADSCFSTILLEGLVTAAAGRRTWAGSSPIAC